MAPRHLVLELGASHQVAVLGRPLDRIAERAYAVRDDRHLVHGVGPRQGQCHHGMPELVVGDDAALQRIEQPVAFFEPGDNALDRIVKVAHRYRLGVAPGGEQGRFVDQIRQVRAGKPGGQRRDLLGVHVRGEPCLFQMYCQDLLAAPLVRPIDQDLAIEPPGTQQGGIKDLRPVGRGEQDQTARRIEAVELGQQLVQRLVLLVLPARRKGAASATERVKFIDKDDCRRVLAGLVE